MDYVDIVTAANPHSYPVEPHRLARVKWDVVPALGELSLMREQSLARSRKRVRRSRGSVGSCKGKTTEISASSLENFLRSKEI